MNKTIFKAENNVLTVERTFNAAVNLVWKAWTEAELLDQWWAPKPWKSQTKSMDFRTGGQRLYAMVGPNNEEHWGITTYTNIELQKHFSGEDAFSDEDGTINPEFPVAKFDNHFDSESEDTKVTIVTTYASEEHLKQVIEMGMKDGLTNAFKNLDELLNNAQPK
ncbi:SRPBCC domain-containing protein [Flagellimonas halotolerans]|uniref:SRPBCC domain-containing protein n=1 Tax=Flagellimonas halotolerans TaxID=3112164 RepID=A0ABU6IRE8_9FLAO|nr:MULTISPECIES: SRPBCC domain-containing protein [unclassified Allomuricauda]MEC3965841.1 SRPBCC domain-containing protein [Muricauda sp. SYSU M86414]MEC4265693.1 SRPBCC domain-containing protein [Muricauda sp. SYSU M84420]